MFTINQRIQLKSSNRCRGTIRYIGTVPNQSESQTWIGVEWDDYEERGKNNGSVSNVQLFTTFANRSSASFVKVEKLKQVLFNGSVTFCEALNKRYVQREEWEETTIGNKVVQIVGADDVSDRLSRVGELKKVGLTECSISSVDPHLLSVQCPNIVELDLTGNLLYNMDDVFRLLDQLPKLEFLNLSMNKITFQPDYHQQQEQQQQQQYHQLKTLVWNFGDLTWKHIEYLVSLFPNLKELHVRDNEIESIDTTPLWKNITYLNLANNKLSSWDQIQKLSMLPSLTKLQLSHNLIDRVMENGNGFASCTSLSLNNNRISDWMSIIHLDLPKLIDLRIDNNPLILEYGPMPSRTFTISLLSKLKILNGSDIYKKDRDEAEKYFVRFFQEKCNDQSFLQSTQYQMRWQQIAQTWNITELSTTIEKPTVSTKTIVEVTIMCDEKKCIKRLPILMTVHKLKLMCCRLFREDDIPLLQYKNSEEDFAEVLDDDNNNLSFYGVKDKGFIIVVCR